MKVDGLDHLVLTVRDVEETCAFYSRVLVMEVVAFGGGRRALAFGSQKINLHEQGCELEPRAGRPMPGSADMCFVTEVPLGEVASHLRLCGVAIVEGPVERTGATLAILSLYFRDLDENLIEVSNALPQSPAPKSETDG